MKMALKYFLSTFYDFSASSRKLVAWAEVWLVQDQMQKNRGRYSVVKDLKNVSHKLLLVHYWEFLSYISKFFKDNETRAMEKCFLMCIICIPSEFATLFMMQSWNCSDLVCEEVWHCKFNEDLPALKNRWVFFIINVLYIITATQTFHEMVLLLQSIPFDLTQGDKITHVHIDNIKSLGFKNS